MPSAHPRDIAHQRCFNHADREAVARCPECGRFFCRECITEHEDRVVCAGCLQRMVGEQERRSGRLLFLFRAGQLAVALAFLFFVFYALGAALLTLPTSFHEGEVWQTTAWD